MLLINMALMCCVERRTASIKERKLPIPHQTRRLSAMERITYMPEEFLMCCFTCKPWTRK